MRRRHEHVSNTAHCANGIGVSWIRLYLPAQTGYPQVDGPIEWLHLTMRRYFEQPVALQWLIGVFCKDPQEIELARGECFLVAIRRVDEYALLKVQYPAAHAYAGSCGRRCCSGSAPQDALYPRQQLAWIKWFGNIVVCTRLEPDYAVDRIGGGGHHNDTDSCTALAQPSRQCETVFARQTDIEQHQRWTVPLHEFPQSRAAVYTADTKILTRQIVHQEVALCRLILNDDYVWAVRHSPPALSPRL
jgi:hypothetical protein